MKLNEKERLVLIGVLRDRDRLVRLDWRGDGVPYGPKLGAHRIRIDDARRGFVPMNLGTWLGHPPSGSEAVMFHRAYRRLEEKGLVERHNLHGYSGRTSHLRLTDKGQTIARELIGN